ncbi:MAG: hypothetical protein ABIG37_03585 [Nanoarchaeota archaeon]
MDLYKKSMEHYEKAINLAKQNKNPFKQLQLSKKMRLLDEKKGGANQVKILSTANSCANCKKHNGKIYSINEAIKKMPLPNKNCSYHLYGEKHGFCRCCYLYYRIGEPKKRIKKLSEEDKIEIDKIAKKITDDLLGQVESMG